MMGNEKVKNEYLLKHKLETTKDISFFTFICILLFVNGALLEICEPGSMKIVLFEILPRLVTEFLLPALLLTLLPTCLLTVFIASRIRIHQIEMALGETDSTSEDDLFEPVTRLFDDPEDDAILLAWDELEKELLR